MSKNSTSSRSLVYGALVVTLFGVVYFIRASIAPITDVLENEFEKGTTSSDIGLISSSLFISYTAMQIPYGLFLEYYSCQFVLSLSSFILFISILLFSISQSLALSIFARILAGIGASPVWICGMAYASQKFDSKQVGLFAGVAQAFGCVCVVFLTWLQAFIYEKYDEWRNIFTIVSFASLCIFIVITYLWFDDQTLTMLKTKDKNKNQNKNCNNYNKKIDSKHRKNSNEPNALTRLKSMSMSSISIKRTDLENEDTADSDKIDIKYSDTNQNSTETEPIANNHEAGTTRDNDNNNYNNDYNINSINNNQTKSVQTSQSHKTTTNPENNNTDTQSSAGEKTSERRNNISIISKMVQDLRIVVCNWINWLFGISGFCLATTQLGLNGLWMISYLRLKFGYNRTFATFISGLSFAGSAPGALFFGKLAQKYPNRLLVLLFVGVICNAMIEFVLIMNGSDRSDDNSNDQKITVDVILRDGFVIFCNIMSGIGVGSTPIIMVIARKYNKQFETSEIGVAFTYTLLISSAFVIQTVIGDLIDTHWENDHGDTSRGGGADSHGNRIYTVGDYDYGFIVIHCGVAVGFFISCFLFCVNPTLKD